MHQCPPSIGATVNYSLLLPPPNVVSMYNLLLFCTALVVGFYLYHWYRCDLARALEARQRVCRRRDLQRQRRAQRIIQLRQLAGAANPSFFTIHDIYNSHAQLVRALYAAGLRQIVPIVGVDFSASNRWQGRRSTWHRQGLHRVGAGTSEGPASGLGETAGSSGSRDHMNLYQRALWCVGRALAPFMRGSQSHCNSTNSGCVMYAFGFGDAECRDVSVFPLPSSNHGSLRRRHTSDINIHDNSIHHDGACSSFEEVQRRYCLAAQKRTAGGPTCLAPIIRQAVAIATSDSKRVSSGLLHLLVVLTDGQLPSPERSASALVEASSVPLSVALVGIGDGPWDTMQTFDDFLPARRFDNVQFVPFNEICARHSSGGEASSESVDMAFALELLMEVPEQFRLLCEMGLTRRYVAAMHADTSSRLHRDHASGGRTPPEVSSPTGETTGCWPRALRMENTLTRFIPGDPSPLLRRRLFLPKKRSHRAH